jgi:hypothetical protein
LFEPVGDYPEGECFGPGTRFLFGRGVNDDTGKCRHLANPATVNFALDFNPHASFLVVSHI